MSIFTILKKLFAPSISRPGVRFGLGADDLANFKQKWTEVEQHMKLGRPSNFKIAIMEADKLLDHVLKAYRYSGQTMGERMKTMPRSKFDQRLLDDMWQAHKLRNELVHNLDYDVQHFEARGAIEKFKRVLERLGAI